MTKRIILICGGRNYGKTTTIRDLFQIGKFEKFIPKFIIIGNKKICTSGGDRSPQEMIKFCNYQKLIEDELVKRLEICKKFGDDAIIIIPFSIIKNTKEPRRGEINEDCMIKPIEWLKEKQEYEVYKIYLKRPNYKWVVLTGGEGETTEEVDALMEKIGYDCLIDNWDEQEKRVDRVRDFIGKI